MEKLTNRELATYFGVSLTQIKRWAVIVLGRDPEADQSGGVPREYTLDDAFLIYIFGEILVKNYRIGLKKAKVYIDIIRTQLIKENLLPSKLDMTSKINSLNLFPNDLLVKAYNSPHYRNNSSIIPDITFNIYGENDYAIKWNLYVHVQPINNDKEELEIYSYNKPIADYWVLFPFHSGNQYVISIDGLLESFRQLISKETN